MTVYIHFEDKRTPVRLHNIAMVRDEGASTVILVSAFGDAPFRFAGVHHLAIEPERADENGEVIP